MKNQEKKEKLSNQKRSWNTSTNIILTPKFFVIGFISDNSNKNKMNHHGVEALRYLFGRSNMSISIKGEKFCELPKRNKRAKWNLLHLFIPNSFQVVRKLHQDKAGMDKTPKDFLFLNSNCWNEKHPPLTFDMTKIKIQNALV